MFFHYWPPVKREPAINVDMVNTHAHLFLVKWFVTLSEIACRLPGFQRGKDQITIIGKSIGVSSPGNITSMIYLSTLPYPTYLVRNKEWSLKYICYFSKQVWQSATPRQYHRKKSGTSKKIQWDFQISRVGSLDFLDLKVNGSPDIQKPYKGRIVQVLTAVILSNIIFSELNSFMHMFNVSTL